MLRPLVSLARPLVDWARRLAHRARLRAEVLRPSQLGRLGLWAISVAASIRARRRETRLTVAVDVAAFWEPLTGIGWYLYRLLEHLAQRDDLRLRLYGQTVAPSPDLAPPAVPLPTGPALEVVVYPVPEDLPVVAGRVVRLLRRLEALLIAADGNRVLFAPNYFLPRRYRLARGALVATVHDLGVRRLPWTLDEDTRANLEGHLERTLFEAARILTPSQAIRAELVADAACAPERVVAIHHGPGHLAEVAATPPPPATPERYALHVGTLEPRKNVLVLLDAWRHLRRRGAEPPPLVLCGRYGWKAEAIRRAVEAAGREGWLVHFGYVPEGQLASLYRGALLVALPSLYEGFGLPAVEALWAEVPLVASDLPVLREVAADAALYAPPDDPEAWADRLAELLERPELRQDLAQRARARVRAFDWRRAAEETARAWFEAAARTC